jgi:hypothetical protein
VIHSRYGHGFAKPYVRDDRLLRTEPATNRVYDYGVNQGIEKLPRLGERMSEIIDQYHNVQPDVLETFFDRGPLRKPAEPTILPSGKRIPGLKLDHPRPLAEAPPGSGLLLFACNASAQPYTPRSDSYRYRNESRGWFFDRVGANLNRAEASALPFIGGRFGIERAEREVNEVAEQGGGWQLRPARHR